jgi:hypothetical protein
MEGLPSIKRRPVPDHLRRRIEIRNRGRHALRDGIDDERLDNPDDLAHPLRGCSITGL